MRTFQTFIGYSTLLSLATTFSSLTASVTSPFSIKYLDDSGIQGATIKMSNIGNAVAPTKYLCENQFEVYSK